MTVSARWSLFYGLTALKYDTFVEVSSLQWSEENRMRGCQKILKATHQSVYTGIETILVEIDENDIQTMKKIKTTSSLLT